MKLKNKKCILPAEKTPAHMVVTPIKLMIEKWNNITLKTDIIAFNMETKIILKIITQAQTKDGTRASQDQI